MSMKVEWQPFKASYNWHISEPLSIVYYGFVYCRSEYFCILRWKSLVYTHFYPHCDECMFIRIFDPPSIECKDQATQINLDWDGSQRRRWTKALWCASYRRLRGAATQFLLTWCFQDGFIYTQLSILPGKRLCWRSSSLQYISRTDQNSFIESSLISYIRIR